MIIFHPEHGENKINCGIRGSRPALKQMKTELHHSGRVLISLNVLRLWGQRRGERGLTLTFGFVTARSAAYL